MLNGSRSLTRALGGLALIAALGAAPALSGCGKSGSKVRLNGAGASFPYPVYAQWAHRYNKLKGVRINYQSIGSGGGIAQIKAKTVDFGASDAPLKAKDLDAAGLWPNPHAQALDRCRSIGGERCRMIAIGKDARSRAGQGRI